MNKVAREGSVQGNNHAGEVRDRLFNGVAGSVIKTASVATEEKKVVAEENTNAFKEKMTKHEAESCGFFKSARQCGWGIYQVSDLDGGAGAVWYLEKDAEGQEFFF